ncbi:hypothetical protein [Zobellella endophytica]|uniref:hypothetical protein n=1 Tax=Zobellella endophytica TaxID=2116700 RepID=UPI0011B24B0B|nr:hypothetical protein [Zobellella endophytica]
MEQVFAAFLIQGKAAQGLVNDGTLSADILGNSNPGPQSEPSRMNISALLIEFSAIFIVLLLATLPAAVNRYRRR